jgi:hypothetical protein
MSCVAVQAVKSAVLLAASLVLPSVAVANMAGNPLCPGEEVSFDPGNGQDIILPEGFTLSVFASGLNFPSGIAFRGNSQRFEVYVLESGAFPASQCNSGVAWQAKGLTGNPFTPDVVVFDQNAKPLRVLGKPTDAAAGSANAFQPGGPAVDIAFEHGFAGGRLFATDNGSNGGRILTVDSNKGTVTPLVNGLPGGPTGQLAFQNAWVYWGSGATTNSGVLSKSDGGPSGQPDIPCQDITLSPNVFDSGGGIFTSGYSLFGHTNPGGIVPAFFNAVTGRARPGVCNGAILRARLAIRARSSRFRGAIGMATPSALRPMTTRWRESYSSARMAQMTRAPDPPTILLTRCISPVRTRTGRPIITAGPIAMVSCRQAKPSSIRSVGRRKISACSTPPTRLAIVRRRASRKS